MPEVTLKGVELMKKKETEIVENLKNFLIAPYIYFTLLLGSLLSACVLFEFGVLETIKELLMYLFGILYMAGFINVLWLIISFVWCVVICCKEKSKRIFFKPYVAVAFILMTVFIIVYFSRPWY